MKEYDYYIDEAFTRDRGFEFVGASVNGSKIWRREKVAPKMPLKPHPLVQMILDVVKASKKGEWKKYAFEMRAKHNNDGGFDIDYFLGGQKLDEPEYEYLTTRLSEFVLNFKANGWEFLADDCGTRVFRRPKSRP